jgi:acyl-CoA synthetase (AMP-forming)/AMP-acid ligase II
VVNTLQYACWGQGAVPALDNAGGLVLDQIGSPTEWPVRLGTGVMVNLTPWFHAMGTVGYLNLPVLTGATLILHRRFDPGHYLADAARFRVTMIGGAPPIFVAEQDRGSCPAGRPRRPGPGFRRPAAGRARRRQGAVRGCARCSGPRR